MAIAADQQWEELDDVTRAELDAQYLKELEAFNEPGLSAEAVHRYLEYRHERPGAAITTYEEGQIRRMLRGLGDPAAIPDPVEQEEHLGKLERLGAEKFHFTNVGTYTAIMMILIFGAVFVWMLLSLF